MWNVPTRSTPAKSLPYVARVARIAVHSSLKKGSFEMNHVCAPRLTLATCTSLMLAAGSAAAQLAPNQTQGFGNGRLVTFTYVQNFDCVDQPRMDLDFNGQAAQSDPNEMQTPICQVVTEPTMDPTGGNLKQTAHLYV